MLLPPEIAEFIAWFARLQDRVGETVRVIFDADERREAGVGELRAPDVGSIVEPGTPIPLPGPDVSARIDLEWAQWLDRSARPELAAMRSAITAALALLAEQDPVAEHLDAVRSAVDALPATVMVSAGQVGAAQDDTDCEVPLRRWLQLAFVTDAEPAFKRLRNALIDGLSELSRRLDDVEKVLDYYELAVQRHAAELEDPAQGEELAHTGLDRVHALIEDLQRRRDGFARRAMMQLVDSTAGLLEDACAPYRAHRPDEIRRRLEERERAEQAGPPRPSALRRARLGLRKTYRAALPIGRQVVADVKTIFAEREPASLRRAYQDLLAHDAADLGRDLPSGYRRLFAPGPIEIADMYVRRPDAEVAFASAIAKWRDGAPQAVLLHGDRGAGKRTLTNHVLATEGGRVRVRWTRLGPRMRDEATVTRALARALGIGTDLSTFAMLARAPLRDDRRRIMVVENAERLLAPSPNGIARTADFLRLVGETAASTLWILLMATPAADFALQRLELAHRIPTVLRLDGLTAAEIRTLVRARHRLSGFELEFADPGLRLIDRVRHPIAGLRSARSPGAAFFAQLWALAGGNPRQALYYWLARASVHPHREGRIVIEPLPAAAAELLPRLGLSQRLILALLAQHGSLADAELRSVLAMTGDGVEGDLQVLCANGFVARSHEQERHFTLRSTMAHALVMELRATNMI